MVLTRWQIKTDYVSLPWKHSLTRIKQESGWQTWGCEGNRSAPTDRTATGPHCGRKPTAWNGERGPLDAGSSLPLSLIYLFLAVLGLLCCTWAFSSWGEWGLPSGSGAQASDCSGFSCGANALGLQGSAAVADRFGCPEACGIFPDQGSTPRPLHWQADS